VSLAECDDEKPHECLASRLINECSGSKVGNAFLQLDCECDASVGSMHWRSLGNPRLLSGLLSNGRLLTCRLVGGTEFLAVA
jgi:hypothetical protein